MPADFISSLFVFILAGFLGFEVIKRVSPLVAHAADVADQRAGRHRGGCGHHHLPGGTRARLSTMLGLDRRRRLLQQHGGGFVITDRMLHMFKTGKAKKP